MTRVELLSVYIGYLIRKKEIEIDQEHPNIKNILYTR